MIRLNIEELKITEKDIEKKIGEQAYLVAEANAKLSTIEMDKL